MNLKEIGVAALIVIAGIVVLYLTGVWTPGN